MAGRVEAIFIRGASDRPAQALERARVEAGRGIPGDRYHSGQGSFAGSALTLVEAEMLESLALDPALARRNLVTRGVDLRALEGRHFHIGSLCCFGVGPCKPPAQEEIYGELRGLARRGGLRADVLSDGEISIGDAVTAAE